MKKLFNYWWNAIPHHENPHYFNVVTFPISAALLFLVVAFILCLVFGPSNPYDEALQNFPK